MMIKNKFILVLLCLLVSLLADAQSESRFTISGYISDANTGEDLISATLYIASLESGATSNEYGFYSVTLPEGNYQLKYEYLGYVEVVKEINLTKNEIINIELTSESVMLEELVISADTKDGNIDDVGMNKTQLDIKSIEKLPALLGEVDVVKALQLLPGVTTVGDGGSGMYVRGGNVDQNLILLDEAPVYNAAHLLGFFSVFNPDAIKGIQFYKGAIPSNYGGRLSSVVDIRMKEGNSKEFAMNAGIGVISSRLTLEAPLGDKGSFVFSGRRTYGDIFFRLFASPDERNNALFFYDLNAKLNYKVNNNNRIYLSAYSGKDKYFEEDEFETDYGNKTLTLRWNHLFSQKVFSNLTIYASDYNYRLAEPTGADAFEWNSDLNDIGVKYDVGIYLSPQSTLKFGLQSILHNIDPGNIKAIGAESALNTVEVQNSQSIENAAYVAHEYDVSDKLKVNYGLRLSGHHNFGPQTVYNYGDSFELIDSTVYKENKVFQTYINLEPRIGLRFQMNDQMALKASYNRTIQYIHLASNSSVTSPLDIWFLSSPNVKPQLADQITIGYFKNYQNNTIEASVEGYYKVFQNTIDFKDHADLLLNDQMEGELRFGQGKSYGVELLVKKNTGKLTGWAAYTLSRTERKIDEINQGNWYPTKYDRTHDIALVGNYDYSDRWSFSVSWIYKTGSAVTYPTGKYYQFGGAIPIYAERNGERAPAYHRMDLGAIWKWKNKFLKRMEQSMTFSLYNAYLRKNAYSINFKSDSNNPNKTIAEKTYLFSIIPAVSWNIKL